MTVPFGPISDWEPSRYDRICNACGGSKNSSGALNPFTKFPTVWPVAIAPLNTRPNAQANTNIAAHETTRAVSVAFRLVRGSIRILGNDPLPLVLRFQNQFHNLTNGAVAAMGLRHVIGGFLRVRRAITGNHRQALAIQHADVHHVVAHVTNIRPIHACLTQNTLYPLNLSTVM